MPRLFFFAMSEGNEMSVEGPPKSILKKAVKFNAGQEIELGLPDHASDQEEGGVGSVRTRDSGRSRYDTLSFG